MRIGILTGGGDVPGLNVAIKAVVNRVESEGHQVVGIRRGWKGLLSHNPADPTSAAEWFWNLDRLAVRKIDRTGGTVLHSSRINPSNVRDIEVPEFLVAGLELPGPFDLTSHVLAVLDDLNIDALIPIGGDDTLSYAHRMHIEGVPVVAIPKTMDNDIHGTDYCIGFSTAITRSVEFLNNLRTSTGSHERIAVVEMFGRNSGETSLIAAYLADADRAIISEVPFDIDRLAALLVDDKRRNPSGYAMMTISEGATMVGEDIVQRGEADAYGHQKLGGIGAITGELIKRKTGEGIIQQQLGYLMRSGAPDALDLMVAKNYGLMAADMVMEGTSGRMVALEGGRYTQVPISMVMEGSRRVDIDELYDPESYKPLLRNMAGKPMFLY